MFVLQLTAVVGAVRAPIAGKSATEAVRVFSALSHESCGALAESLALANEQQNGTRWLAADAEPQTALERAAAEVFALHTAGLDYDASRSGAEYWVQSHIEAALDSNEGAPSNGIYLRAPPFAAA